MKQVNETKDVVIYSTKELYSNFTIHKDDPKDLMDKVIRDLTNYNIELTASRLPKILNKYVCIDNIHQLYVDASHLKERQIPSKVVDDGANIHIEQDTSQINYKFNIIQDYKNAYDNYNNTNNKYKTINVDGVELYIKNYSEEGGVIKLTTDTEILDDKPKIYKNKFGKITELEHKDMRDQIFQPLFSLNYTEQNNCTTALGQSKKSINYFYDVHTRDSEVIIYKQL